MEWGRLGKTCRLHWSHTVKDYQEACLNRREVLGETGVVDIKTKSCPSVF